MLRDTYHPASDSLANEDSPPDNEDIGLASMNSGGKQVTTKNAAPNLITVAAAALGRLTFDWLSREAIAGTGVYGSWIPCSGLGSTPNGELPEGHIMSPVEQIQMTSPPILTLQMMGTLPLILGFVRLENQNGNLGPNLWFMLPGMILRTVKP